MPPTFPAGGGNATTNSPVRHVGGVEARWRHRLRHAVESVFAIVDGHLLTCSGRTEADEWPPHSTDPQSARRGLVFLEEMATLGSPYHLELPMPACHGLVLASARIWHTLATPRLRSGATLSGLFSTDLIIAGR